MGVKYSAGVQAHPKKKLKPKQMGVEYSAGCKLTVATPPGYAELTAEEITKCLGS
jgi:hypothetical protein